MHGHTKDYLETVTQMFTESYIWEKHFEGEEC